MKQEWRKASVMYKSQLQEYAQKASIPPPVYEFVKEGASHEPRFKAIVILDNVTYESPPGFPNLKSAEHAAAKAALDGLFQSTGGSGVAPSPVHESGLCKNLLQEYAQKNSLPLPVYQSQRSGEDHAPTFTSSVEIAGVKYSGGSAKNKKDAEIKAARTALLAIQSAKTYPDFAENDQVGLGTLVTSHLNNSPGKKRGRGMQITHEEPCSGRLKIDPAIRQLFPEDLTKASMRPPPEKVISSSNLVVHSKPDAQVSSNTSSATPLNIAELFATPGAQKILGTSFKPPHSKSPYLTHATPLSLSQQNIEFGAPSPTLLENNYFDAQGNGNGIQNGVAETMSKVEKSLIEASQSPGLRALAGCGSRDVSYHSRTSYEI